ncbi:pyrroline-5-carboxylate reductase [Modicisalibacter tunisiensis]|uniref:Pyrroline-5-carboxylate reductase n=1 Tax=Modicisalibacter tunisiensis TaxID=390637 RepID=A0ABS7WV87_9GAMM|nr:pyrroline-5-carboxylate reductase [Modicisalibacter tunisiensis]MBZ9540081.1 pyrroline-5-carboxylate reductase [Modicisalibacter tunisiensis]MBZ9566525.1 pyrroline-5-carboxylate reductase [Modicisalibacter tunisiensis]
MASQVTFIGAGNMASAIFGGMIDNGYPATAITATSPDAERLTALAAERGIHTTDDNAAAVAEADVVVLAVKPQIMREVCEGLRDAVQARRPLIVSVAAGLTAETLDTWLGGDLAVVRCMPNTPSLVGAGASGLYANARVSDAQRELATTLLEAVGIVEWVDDEALLEAVTAVSGSGPAYFFLVFEALEEAGVRLGLPAATARRLALQTGLGAATMAQRSEHDPAQLRRNVMSPGGTTERAIHSLEDGGLRELFADATEACAARAREMAAELGESTPNR